MKTILTSVALLICSLAYSQAGSNLFSMNKVHVIKISSINENTLVTVKDYQSGTVEIDGTTIYTVGVKSKGNISWSHPNNKRPIKIKTNKYSVSQEYDGIKEFTLHNSYQDPSLLREKLTYEVCLALGLKTLRTAFAEVYVNNTYYGLYTIVEGKDEMYKQVFNDRNADAIETFDFGNMCDKGTQGSAYKNAMAAYDLDNGDPTTAWDNFAIMVNKANTTTPNSNYITEVSKYLNIIDFVKYQAANVYMMNFDSYIGYLGNQIYMHDKTTGVWQVVPWDFNASWKLWEGNVDDQNIAKYPIFPTPIKNGCIAKNILQIPELKQVYLETMCKLATDLMEPSKMFQKIDSYKALIKTSVYNDVKKMPSDQEFDQALEYGEHKYSFVSDLVPALKEFVQKRHDLIISELAKENFACTVGVRNNNFTEVKTFPNPVENTLNISADASDIKFLSITNILGEKVYTSAGKTTINLSELNAGTYFIKVIFNNGNIAINKFIKK